MNIDLNVRSAHPVVWISLAGVQVRKACLSVRPFICLSVCMEQVSSHYTDFNYILYSPIFRIFVEKSQVSLMYDKNNKYFTRRPICIYSNISLNYSQNKKVFRKMCRKNQNTHTHTHIQQTQFKTFCPCLLAHNC